MTEIARYRDGHLLLLEDLPNEQWRITDFDPSAGTFVPLCDSEGLNGAPVHGLLYDPWRGRVLVESGEELLALSAGGACEVVAYLPLLSFGGRALAQRRPPAAFAGPGRMCAGPPCRRRSSGRS